MEKTGPYIDSHAHLAMLEHASEEEILRRAHLAGVTKIVSVSTNESSWEPNHRLAQHNPNVYYTVGIHPHEAHTWTEGGGKMFQWFRDHAPRLPPRCVAIGEMGLDFYYDFCPKEVQVHAFESQLAFAAQVELPVVIHCRDAFDTLFESIRRVGLGKRGGVLHCFTGTADEARKALDMGLKISFSGILTFKSAGSLREAAKIIPLTEVFVETDCPFLAPIPHRGKPNEPSFLPLTAACLAETVGSSLQEIADQTTLNAIEFFRLA